MRIPVDLNDVDAVVVTANRVIAHLTGPSGEAMRQAWADRKELLATASQEAAKSEREQATKKDNEVLLNSVELRNLYKDKGKQQ